MSDLSRSPLRLPRSRSGRFISRIVMILLIVLLPLLVLRTYVHSPFFIHSGSRHRLLAATIAGFLSQSRLTRASELFDTLWRGMVNRIDDPYVRIMLSRIGGEGWESVLRDEAVPFLDRVAIATCNLDDGEVSKLMAQDLTTQFSGFLKERSERFLGNLSPSLHGLALTGLTASGLKLIQRWLERTGDIQTAALLSTFLPSSRLSTSENLVVKRWREGYRDLLDRWGMWNERAKYDVVWLEMGRALGEQRGDTPGEVCPA